MAKWKNDNDGNRDTYGTNAEGKLGGKVGHVLQKEWIDAEIVSGGVLRLTANSQKAKAGQYVYRSGFLQGVTPPPVDPPPATGELPAYFTAHDDNDNELARYVRQ